MPRGHLRHRADLPAAEQDGIVSRAQLHELCLHRRDVRSQVDARRWHKPSPHTVAVFTGELTERQRWWVAVLEAGCPDTALDGAAALKAAGLVGYAAPITVSCPRGKRPRPLPGRDPRVTRWRRPGDHVSVGIPRVRPAAAAVHGALWAAATDRQAALLLVLPVQQRLTTAARLAVELARIGRHPRRRLLARLIADVEDGAQALGELDFASLCRRHRLPQPSRQLLRRAHSGRVYLDAYFDDYSLVVEIDGMHHVAGNTPVDDAMRQNELTLDADTVLRIPLLGLRLQPADFMEQVARGLRQRGWDWAA